MNLWKLGILMTSLFVSGYDTETLYTSLTLSGDAYCHKELYNKVSLGGKFVYDSTIYDWRTDLQGFIGVVQEKKAIYVVLRGSSSPMNWFRDFEVAHVPYDTFPECNCSVHRGFYLSALGVKDDAITAVRRLRTADPTYSVHITGHSYAASCGQLLAMEFVKAGIPVSIYNFGQPRVGDASYSTFMTSAIDPARIVRVTHARDIVPHVPTVDMGYLHSEGELFEDEFGELHSCIGGEDPACSQQYSFSQLSVDDHITYLGQPVGCEESIGQTYL